MTREATGATEEDNEASNQRFSWVFHHLLGVRSGIWTGLRSKAVLYVALEVPARHETGGHELRSSVSRDFPLKR